MDIKEIKLFIGILLLSINSVNAATSSSPMQIAATISPKCTIAANNMSFSSIGLSSIPNTIRASTTLSISCTKDTNYNVFFDAGLYGYDLDTLRKMKHATENEYLEYYLEYNNELIESRTIFHNNAGLGLDKVESLIINGIIYSNQEVKPGNYSDTTRIYIVY